MIRITTAVVIGCLTGCATVASGPYGVPVDEHNKVATPTAAPTTVLKVSAGELNELSSPYFGAVEVTFENPTPSWVQIDTVDLDFGSPQRNQNVFIPWGADIDAWRLAIGDRRAIDRANANLNASSLTVLQTLTVGVDAMAIRDRQGGSAARRGGVVALGAVGTLGAAAVAGAPSSGDAGPDGNEPFPPSHLLTVPIRVPPGLFTKRWLLLYTSDNPPGGCIDSMVLGYTTSDRKHERVALPIKSPLSAWQFTACAGPASAKPF